MTDHTARRRRLVALIIGAAALVALAGWAFTYTSIFHAHHIRVQGAGVLTAEEVRTLAGVSEGTNVVHFDRQGTVDRLEDSPWIADASVHVELPDTIVLGVTERRPVGSDRRAGGARHPRERRDPPADDGRRAGGTPGGAGRPRARRREDQRRAAAALLAVLDPVVMARVREVSVGQDGIVSLALASGTTVNAGEVGDEAERQRRFAPYCVGRPRRTST